VTGEKKKLKTKIGGKGKTDKEQFKKEEESREGTTLYSGLGGGFFKADGKGSFILRGLKNRSRGEPADRSARVG